jgi:hypothetical protein
VCPLTRGRYRYHGQVCLQYSSHALAVAAVYMAGRLLPRPFRTTAPTAEASAADTHMQPWWSGAYPDLLPATIDGMCLPLEPREMQRCTHARRQK